MNENFKLLGWSLIAGSNFGHWQHSLSAGVWMFTISIMIGAACITFNKRRTP
jgi:hypothetical protein